MSKKSNKNVGKCVKALFLHIFFANIFAVCTKIQGESSSRKAKRCDTVRNIDDRNEDMGTSANVLNRKGAGKGNEF